MGANIEPLPGTSDIWEPETLEWIELEQAARDVFHRYGYGERKCIRSRIAAAAA